MNSIEVRIEQLSDVARQPMDPIPVGSLTALVKTFERPRELRRLVRSVQRLQAGLPIIVVDDSRCPRRQEGVETLEIPFNSGVSAGRNAGLDRVRTPYFVLLDDDFVFYRGTDLARAVHFMTEHPEVDILGGAVVNLPEFRVHDYSGAPLFSWAAPPRIPFGASIGDLPVLAKVPQFFVGRTETVRAVGWMDDLKTMEHREFFSRASGRLVTVQDVRLRILHARNPFDRTSPERTRNRQEAREVLRTVAAQNLRLDG